MKKFWDINEILPYQRNFNLIEGGRNIGKTYGTLKFLMKQSIVKRKKFIYLCRTKYEKDDGILEKAIRKVEKEYMDFELEFTKDYAYVVKNEVKIEICRCIALSEYNRLKRESFDDYYYIIFDEYSIEKNSTSRYVNGYQEPDVLLNLYHTIDRENDRVKVFMLSNNVTENNPYRIHPAFAIPHSIGKGEIWCSENVLFQNASRTEFLTNREKTNKFLRMINGTDYGRYSVDGKTSDDYTMIRKLSGKSSYLFTLMVDNHKFGVYTNDEGVFVHYKYDPSHKVYATNPASASENVYIFKGTTWYNYLKDLLKNGKLYFTNEKVKFIVFSELIKYL